MPPTTAPIAMPPARFLEPAIAAPVAPPATAPTIVPVPCLLPGPQAASTVDRTTMARIGTRLIASSFGLEQAGWRSEERRVGKAWRPRWAPYHQTKEEVTR